MYLFIERVVSLTRAALRFWLNSFSKLPIPMFRDESELVFVFPHLLPDDISPLILVDAKYTILLLSIVLVN